ncbi:MAG: type IV pilus secretin PilQ [Gammaproteobacteria bacterium]
MNINTIRVKVKSHLMIEARNILMLGLLIMLQIVFLQNALAGPMLNDIGFVSLPSERVQIRMDFSETLQKEPLSFTIDNPSRIALDFPGATLGLKDRTQSIGIGSANSITAVEASGRTRVVLNLKQMVPYELKVTGNTVIMTLDSANATASPVPVSRVGDITAASDNQPTQVASSSKNMAMPKVPQISNIDFRRGPKGEGRVIISLSDPTINPNIREKGGKINIDFEGTTLPTNLDRKLDVLDFATPIKEIDTFPYKGGTRMVVTPHGNYEHLAYQSDDQLTIEVKPLTKQEEEELKKEKFGYSGEKLSLNFQNIEVRAVLQLIADFTGLNMVASDTVEGTVTLRLKNVPWDQALDIILKSKGLDMRKNGNVIMVAPSEEIATREKLELEAQLALEELAPLHTEFMQINYAKAADIADLLKDDSNNLLSERGNITLDERTNTLLVQDTAAKLEDMYKVISTLDIPVRQVLIESRVVIADEDFAKDLGVQFGLSYDSLDPDNNLGAAIGGRRGGDTSGLSTAFGAGDDGVLDEHYIVNLPVVSQNAGSIGLALGKIGSHLLHLELSALQQEGRGEVVSSPRVITANQKEALIEQGTEIPYQEATSAGATAITFKKAVLSLRVTPQITPDDRIIMDLAVNKDAVGEIFLNVPSIDTQKVQTQVLVDNGETVVLGGVFTQTRRNEIDRVPFFSDIPYLGWMFKGSRVENDKNELLIFVTPKILKDSLTSR